MSTQYSTIQQHEPLRVPSGWDKQERVFVSQLEQVLDDLYSRFNRLSIKDFNKSLQSMIASSAEGLAELTVDVDGIRTRVTRTENGLTVAESRITQTADAITAEVTRASAEEGSLSSRITQTATDITSEVSRATIAEGTLNSRITQTASEITSEVTRASTAEGDLSSRITQTASEITSEVTRASEAEGELSSRITQTADSISSTVQSITNRVDSLGTIYYSQEEPSNPNIGDTWIRNEGGGKLWSEADALKWSEIEQFKWEEICGKTKTQVWTGDRWETVSDNWKIEQNETQILQLSNEILLKASKSQLDDLGDRVATAEASIKINAGAITQEVTNRTNAISTAKSEANSYADGKASAAETNAKNASIAKTTTYQTAESIVNSAKTYTDGELTNYSTLTHTSESIKAEVTKIENGTTASGKVSTSTVSIDANGISMETGGKIELKAGSTTNRIDSTGVLFDGQGQFRINSNGEPAFIVNQQGDISAKSASFGVLSVGGNNLPAMVVSNDRPTITGCLWFKPVAQSTMTSATYTASVSGNVYLTDKVYNFTSLGSGNMITGNVIFTIPKIGITNTSQTQNNKKTCEMSVFIVIGSTEYQVGSTVSSWFTEYGDGLVATNISTSQINVPSGTTSFTLRVKTNLDYMRMQYSEAVTINAKSTSTSTGGDMDVEIKWIP